MARRPVLGGFSLDLFGGSGVDAGVFNVASQSRQNEAYLALTRVEVQWEAGKVSNADYLAALKTYVETFPADSSERLNQQSRLESTTYRIERNVLVSQVNAGKKSLTDLLAYDTKKLEGLNPNSQEYLDRQSRVFDTQGQVFNEEEKAVIQSYSDGRMTTTQLQKWYEARRADPRFTGNVELQKSMDDRIGDLKDRVVDERDAKMVSDYNAGKISPAKFLSYASSARARYKEGTSQAQEWDDRIDSARDAAVEDDLAYRYSLSQDYLRLQQFVATNQPPKGGTRTSTKTTTRTVLGADGQWHVVKSQTTSSKPYAPSQSELAAWQQRKVEVDEAKRQMAAIAKKVGALPGGFVSTQDMIGFYSRQLARFSRGSSEWYAVQSKIDGLKQTLSSERVLSRQGIRLSFAKVKSEKRETYQLPGTPKTSTSSGGSTSSTKGTSSSGGGGGGSASGGGTDYGDFTLQDFMNGIAKVESGGRYDARNSQSGAYGKYQIMPANWSAWAQRAGLPANAQPTPENQEKVAKAAFTRLYNKYDGDYSKMAAEWFAGAAGAGNGDSSKWGPKTRAYVSHVMGAMGSSYNPGRSAGSTAPASRSGVGGGGATAGTGASSTARTSGTQHSSGKPSLKVVTGVSYRDREERTITRTGAIPDYAQELSYGRQVVKTTVLDLPKGLDARQFRKIYDAMDQAYRKGQEAALVDLGGGHRMQIFIGDDPDEQIQTMRDLDDLRVDLADAELQAYKGTGSEAAKSQSALAARKDAAEHELLILTVNNPRPNARASSNPIAAGLRILEKIKSGVSAEVAAMNEAYARGDVTGAYLHGQKIAQMTSGLSLDGKKVGDVGQLIDLVNEANSRVAGIVGSTGVAVPSSVQHDLETLNNAFAEISKAAEPGSKTILDLDNVVKKDRNGQVVWTQPGPRGEVKLRDDVMRVITPAGKVEIKPNTDTQVRPDGTVGTVTPDNMVPVVMKQGASIINAYATYKVGQVGFAILANGQRVPLMGKIVSVPTDRNDDGVADSTSTYFENPLSPGRWSHSAIVYKAPDGVKVVYDQKGGTEPSFQFTVGNRTVTLATDAKTGTYQTWVQQAPGMFGQGGTDPQAIGTANQNPDVAKLLEGWSRDTTGQNPMDALNDVGTPALNFTPDEWATATLRGTVQTYRDFIAAYNEAHAVTHAPELTPDRLAKRATSAPDLTVKSGQMAVNADLARERLDEKRGVTRTTLTPLPKLTPGAVNQQRNPNRDLMAIDREFGQTRGTPTPKGGAKTGGATKPGAAKPAAKPAASKPAPRRTTTARKPRKITPLPKPTQVATTTRRVAF